MPGALGGFAGHECLPRGRSLAAIGCQGRVGSDQFELFDRRAQRIGADLGDHGIRSLTDIGRALMQLKSAINGNAKTDGGGVRQSRVSATVPAGRYADAAFDGVRAIVERPGAGERLAPKRLERIQALGDADAIERLSANRNIAVPKRITPAKFQTVQTAPIGQFVVQRFLQNGGLRYAEPSKGARNRAVRMNRAGRCTIVRRAVGPGSMNRYAARNRRPPACVGARVEVTLENHPRNAAFRIGADPARHLRGMAFRRR